MNYIFGKLVVHDLMICRTTFSRPGTRTAVDSSLHLQILYPSPPQFLPTSQTDPKSRVSLYKLRQTWNSYISHRKLAAIDKHVHALDPNWPITATDTSPASPSIFVNPKFLEVRRKGG